MGNRSIGVGSSKILPTARDDHEKDLQLALEQFFRQVDDAINFLLRPNIVTKTDNYTLTDNDHTVLGNAIGGAITLTLPESATVEGKCYTIKKTDASGNAVTIDGYGAETIDGSATHALSSQYDGVIIQSDGTNWTIRSTT